MTTTTADAPATEAQTEKPVKVDPTKPCFCSHWEVYGDADDEVFNTGCNQTTKRQFAQGHDARLVSFLVDGVFDGYHIRFVKDGVSQSFADPEAAARTASDQLGAKAAKATLNRRAKTEAAANKLKEREQAQATKAAEKEKAAAAKAEAAAKKKADAAAAKAAKPQAEVAAGSGEGAGVPTPEGQVKIKVGRWEYNATINPDTQEASFVDGKGEAQTIERDGYRLLDA